MATLAKRGVGTPVTSGTTWATTTNAVDGTPPATPATYATWTNATSSAVGYIEVTGYDFAAIGAGDTLNSVTVLIRHFVNNTGRVTSVTYQPYSGATPIGTASTATLTTLAHDNSATFAVTKAQLQAANFKVRVTITHAANTQSLVFSLDHIDVTADYTIPATSLALGTATATLTAVVLGRTTAASLVVTPAVAAITAGTLAITNVGGETYTEGSNVAAGTVVAPITLALPTAVANLTAGTVARVAGLATLTLPTATVALISGTVARTVGTTSLALPTAVATLTPGTLTLTAGGAPGDTYTTGSNVATVTVTLPVVFTLPTATVVLTPGTVALTAVAPITLALGSATAALTPGTLVAIVTLTAGQLNTWNGTAWVAKPVRYWTGSAWVQKPMKVWDGSTWELV